MKRKLLPVIMLGLVLFRAAAALADGDIYTGGPAGLKITSLPYTISAPGAYYLGGNLTYAGTGNAITINGDVNNVTIDLMGFTITGSGSGTGISMWHSVNVEIRNGTVTGFTYGIYEQGGGRGHRVLNVRAAAVTSAIRLIGNCHLVKGCEAITTGTTETFMSDAIFIGDSGTISGCTARFITSTGINMSRGLISGNVVIGSGSAGTGILAYEKGSVVEGNEVSGCSTGIYITSGVTVIGNSINAPATIGIYLSDDRTNMLDQNTVVGSGGFHYFNGVSGTFSNIQVRGTGLGNNY